ncbi:MAG: zinc ribbon domain-containing protein [Planctomycetota bacterium]
MEPGFVCPNCGAPVPERAKACPECGSDEKTGWSPDTLYDGLDLPDLDDAGTSGAPSGRTRRWLLVAAAILALLGMLWFLLRQTGG